MRQNTLGRLLASAAVVVMFVAACAAPNDTPLAPTLDKDQGALNGLAVCDPVARESVSRKIGKAGGVVSTSAARITIPEGALSEDVEVSLTQLGDRSNTIEVAPGLQAEAGIKVEISYRNCEKSPTGTHRIVAVDESNNVVGNEESFDDPENRTVNTITTTLHSRYAVAW